MLAAVGFVPYWTMSKRTDIIALECLAASQPASLNTIGSHSLAAKHSIAFRSGRGRGGGMGGICT